MGALDSQQWISRFFIRSVRFSSQDEFPKPLSASHRAKIIAPLI